MLRSCVCGFALLSLGLLSSAQAVVVTSPAGLLTNANPAGISDPLALDTWLRRNVRSGGSVGITGDFPRAFDGSMYLSLGGSSNAKADAEIFFSDVTGKTLGNLSALKYDWYRDSTSTATAWLHPVLRLYIDADGSNATTTDRGYLVFERGYNPNTAAVPVDQWITDDVFNFDGAGDSANLWWVQFGVGINEVYNRDLADWIAGQSTAGFAALSGNSVIYGLSTGVGSGWGAFEGASDRVTIAFGTQPFERWNFELTQHPDTDPDDPTNAVPEPASAALSMMALLALGAGALARRDRR